MWVTSRRSFCKKKICILWNNKLKTEQISTIPNKSDLHSADSALAMRLSVFKRGKQAPQTLPRRLCATASRSEGTCSGFGVSSALRRQICTAKAPWGLQREREMKVTAMLGGADRVTQQKHGYPFELHFIFFPCFYHWIFLCTPPLLPFLFSALTNFQSGDVGRFSLSSPQLAAHERALQGIVEIIITVIALVNTS